MQHRRYVNARKHSIPEHIVNPGYQTIVPGDKMPDGLVCISMLLGLSSEVLGYIAQVLLNGDPFMRNYFLWYLFCLLSARCSWRLSYICVLGEVWLCMERESIEFERKRIP
jgi:hypothetical protein